MVKPNFFIIGAPKCGTTALSEYLRDHPNVFMCNPKEPFYFDFDFSKPDPMTLEGYLKLYSKADPNIHKAIGEASTFYLFSKCAVKEIVRFNPEAKLIAMLRNPIELVQGRHSQMAFNGFENIADFEEAWRAEEDRKKGKRIPLNCWDVKRLFYSEWGMLGDQVERLFASAPKDRIKVILFEDFIADTAKIYQEVLLFLGLPPDDRKSFPKVNENKKIRSIWLQQILHYAAEIKSKPPHMPKFGLGKLIIALNSQPTKRKPSSDELRGEMIDFYHDDIIKLSKLLGRDLSHWISKGPPPGPPKGDQPH